MSHILIDGRWFKATGIGRYVESLTTQLLKIDQKNNYSALIRPEDKSKLTFSDQNIRLIETDIMWYTPQEQLLLPKVLQDAKPDLVHFANFNVPLQYRKPFVVTIHDLTLLKFKNIRGGLLSPFTYRLKDVVMRHVLKTAIVRSKVIFTPSQYVADEIVKRYRVLPEKIIVTYNAADSLLTTPKISLAKFGITKPYLLYVGNVYPHKNLERLIRALPLINTDRAKPYHLVIAGKKDDFHNRLEKLADKLKLRESVHFTDWVSEAELAGLYRSAAAYVFPSLSEGFGIPGLEAMHHSVPVISSNMTCLPEVYGQAAEYFDPLRIDDMARAIKVVIDDPA
ncbi:glycosyltransferase family 4 protein, partial [Candidatus Saccharibacteria bacterium]|nr:glycosyltransferase family 4 protein [Candidatus Saccharibacteria bacterium]